MGRTKKTKTNDPVVSATPKVKKKYSRGFPVTQSKLNIAKKALFEIESGESITKTAEKYGLSYSYLQRRASGKVSVQCRNGPPPYLSKEEEDVIANYVSEMALRGMGLGPSNIMDLVQDFLQKEKRKNPFPNNRPNYTWYYGFMARHCYKLEKWKETLLGSSRSKAVPGVADDWFEKFKQFLSDRNMLDKPHLIWNADESVFSMRNKTGAVIGPSRNKYTVDIPHSLGGLTMKCLTVMFCGNAEGSLLPPFFIYPEPKPSAYDPMFGGFPRSRVEYTHKGCMDASTFAKFIDHFDSNVSKVDRPVLLLVDSVSSHINMDIFKTCVSKGIELFQIVPNTTDFMQPLDKGVFGPLKREWYKIVRRNTKANPENLIDKRSFAAKLHEAYIAFYKPRMIISSFRGSGIYPVDRKVISDDNFKPSKTISFEKEQKTISPKEQDLDMSGQTAKKEALKTSNAEITVQEGFDEKQENENKSTKSEVSGQTLQRKIKGKTTKPGKIYPSTSASVSETICPICHGSFEVENGLQIGTVWVECDACCVWMHKDCIPLELDFSDTAFDPDSTDEFICHMCLEQGRTKEKKQ